ncbi:hypothetical protein EGR_05176 [Echinococcus granulosus]|uniref:Uncharacterized protein n=1 Tax=Echinococcus granulosus TaxID=6210 RepID=W6UF35_ECHGR|nr:hypothetical protein EGR_05176 [Echinococcus granulosus]EUB60015.1 hypothetical protein EGR_05176 [Echinococcus granulosus]
MLKRFLGFSEPNISGFELLYKLIGFTNKKLKTVEFAILNPPPPYLRGWNQVLCEFSFQPTELANNDFMWIDDKLHQNTSGLRL